METWDVIRSRRNVRAYEPRPIPEEALARVLEAGRRSPSARNTQPWDFVVCTDRAQLQRLAGVWQGAGHVATSAATIAVVSPDEPPGRARDLLQYDLGQATLVMMLAAADLGIGSAHAAAADQALARELLGFPEDRALAWLVALGYPADRPLRPIEQLDRRSFDEVVHRGRW
jgi:nitroreductase